MMIDVLEKEREFLEDYYLIIEEINFYLSKDKGFILRDLLSEDQQNDNTMIHTTKGILQTLTALGYIEIFSLYNGKTGFVYRAKKKIEVKK